MEQKFVTLDELERIAENHALNQLRADEALKYWQQTGMLFATGGIAEYLLQHPANKDQCPDPIITEDIDCEIIESKQLPPAEPL